MDWLKEFLGDELYAQVVEALKDKSTDEINLANLASGEWISKKKYDGELGRLNGDHDKLKTEYQTLQKNLEDLKNSSGDIETIKADAAKALDASKDKLTELEDAKTASDLDYEIKLAVVEAGAKDGVSVMAHLDKEKIKLEDGKLSGLDEQLKVIQEKQKYLFGEPKKIFTTAPPNTQTPPEETDTAEWQTKLKAAREADVKAGNNRQAIKVKQAAKSEGVIL